MRKLLKKLRNGNYVCIQQHKKIIKEQHHEETTQETSKW